MAADINEPVQRGFLEQMAEASQARAAIAEIACGMAEMRQRAEQSTAPPPLILSDAGFDLIAEVGFSDFLILSNNFGKSAISVAAVPEPNAAMLLLIGLVSLVRRRSNESKTRGATS